MHRKQDAKRGSKAEIKLSAEESQELQMILDRLMVQNPEGESLKAYLESLRKALMGRENMVATLIDRLSKSPSEVSFSAFLAMRDLVGSKEFQKAVKLAAYRFAQQGFSPPEEIQEKGTIVLVHEEEKQSIASVLPNPETFWLISALIQESGSVESLVVTAFAEKSFQALTVKVAESSGKLYREFMQKVTDHFHGKPCEIPIWHAARLFFDLIDFCKGSVLPSETERAKRALRPHFDPERLPYVYELMSPVEHPDKDIREINVESFVESMSSPWLVFSREDILPYYEKLQEIEHPVLVISPEVQRERSVAVVAQAADHLCAGRMRSLYQRYFEEYAMWYKLSGDNDLANTAWTIAQHLHSGAAASENPVVLEMVLMSISYYWPSTAETKPESGGREDNLFRETDSGLIIPK